VLLRARAFRGWGRASPVVYVPDALLGDDAGAALWSDVEAWAHDAWRLGGMSPLHDCYTVGDEHLSQRFFVAERADCQRTLLAHARCPHDGLLRFRVVGLANASASAALGATAQLSSYAAAAAARRALGIASEVAAADPAAAPAAASLRAAGATFEGKSLAKVMGLRAVTPPHVDGHPLDSSFSNKWFVVFNIGCAAAFRVAGREVVMRSGDALVFHNGYAHYVRHSMQGVVPDSCPATLAHALNGGRTAVVRLVPDTPLEMLPHRLAFGCAQQDAQAANARARLLCCAAEGASDGASDRLLARV
jgi:hypothetical protein